MKPTDFSVHVTTFLTHYLAAQRNVSPNTIKAYRDVFTLLSAILPRRQGNRSGKTAPRTARRFCGGSVPGLLGKRKALCAHCTRNHRLAACTHSSDMSSPRSPTACFSAKKSSPFPSGDTLVRRLDIFSKRTWLKSWRSRT